jgi:hypothetical protein
MRLEPHISHLIAEGRLRVDASRGEVFSAVSNTPTKPLGALTAKGYLRICMSIDGVKHHAMVHRVVWVSAHGLVPAGKQLDHINGIKTDNRLANLCLVDQPENMRRAAASGLTNGGWRDAPRDAQSGQFCSKMASGVSR